MCHDSTNSDRPSSTSPWIQKYYPRWSMRHESNLFLILRRSLACTYLKNWQDISIDFAPKSFCLLYKFRTSQNVCVCVCVLCMCLCSVRVCEINLSTRLQSPPPPLLRTDWLCYTLLLLLLQIMETWILSNFFRHKCSFNYPQAFGKCRTSGSVYC